MYTLLVILAILVCVFLGFIVLVQNPKGGGLTSNFSSSSQLMGVQKTGDFLEKGTWFLAIALMVLSLVINISVKGTSDRTDGGVSKDIINKASTPTNTGAAPSMLPGTAAPAKAGDTTKK